MENFENSSKPFMQNSLYHFSFIDPSLTIAIKPYTVIRIHCFTRHYRVRLHENNNLW
jgi:hypothetical protein